MTLHRSADHRAQVAKLRAEIRILEKPNTEAAKKLRKEKARERREAIGKPAPGQRQPRVKDAAYLSWIRGLPCIGCIQDQTPSRSLRCEAAHVRFGDAQAGWPPTGMAEKPDDRRTLPLCAGHHREGPKAQHAAGERAWWEARGIYPPDLCAVLGAAYDARQDGAAVIRQFATSRRP